MTMIGIIDCGISNVGSVHNAFAFLDIESRLIQRPEGLSDCSHIVLPGDGAFPDGMERLMESGMHEALVSCVGEGRPLLGICLGMQLMVSEGDEFRRTRGLGLISGRVSRIEPNDPSLPIPQVGWNEVSFLRQSRVIAGFGKQASFYFMNSFAFSDAKARAVTALCDYGGPVAAMIEQEHIFGVQFHPEKSQRSGLKLLRNFAHI
jgi:glutamine amidotransferase